MKTEDVFRTYLNNNIEVKNGHLCLFEDYTKKRVKQIRLEQSHIDEAKAARARYDYSSTELVVALREIVESRAEEWLEIKTPEFFIDGFTENLWEYRREHQEELRAGFDSFKNLYEKYWAAVGDTIERTLFDEEPNESDLQRAYDDFLAALNESST